MAVGGFGMLTETGTVAEERNITISGGRKRRIIRALDPKADANGPTERLEAFHPQGRRAGARAVPAASHR